MKHFRDKLYQAMDAQSITKLRLAIDKFEQLEAMEERFELKKAKRMLNELERMKSELNKAFFYYLF